MARNLTGGSSTQGIFVGVPGSLQTVALQGGPAPGGGTYGNLGGYVLNGSGQVAFNSDLGIFVGAPGSVRAVAITGTAAPAGGNFAGPVGYYAAPALNANGQVAFLTDLTGGSSTEGLFAGSPGALEAVLLVGDVINVASGGGVDDRTVSSIGFPGYIMSGGQDGIAMSFNDAGLLVYEVGFTDGSSGIFTSQITPVPEPTFLLPLAGFGGLLAVRVRRVARRRAAVGQSGTA